MEEIKTILVEYCKKWTFQQEECPETKRKHFQGRLNLKEKTFSEKSCAKLLKVNWRLSVTSKNNKDNDFYVAKEGSRIDGPWKDTDVEIYIPENVRNINLYPWQQQTIDSAEIKDDRTVNVIIDKKGSSGKSTIARFMECREKAIWLPPMNDPKELMQAMCCICMDKKLRNPKLVYINLPRAMDQTRINGIFNTIEQIKDGKLYDFRYHYKKYYIESPQIWIFMNIRPDTNALSNDRWKLWEIDEDKKLISIE